MPSKFVQSFLVLALTWLILAGPESEELLFGIFFSFLIAAVSREHMFRRGILPKIHPRTLIHSYRYFTHYILGEIIAHLKLVKIILMPTLDISPAILHAKLSVKNHKTITAIANSLTLNPGTLALEASENEMTIHCIDMNRIDAVGDMLTYEKNLRGILE